jgi:hypothetical protein
MTIPKTPQSMPSTPEPSPDAYMSPTTQAETDEHELDSEMEFASDIEFDSDGMPVYGNPVEPEGSPVPLVPADPVPPIIYIYIYIY